MATLLIVLVSIASIHFAGLIAQRRGRSFRTWAWIGAAIGPLALPLLLIFPDACRHADRP